MANKFYCPTCMKVVEPPHTHKHEHRRNNGNDYNGNWRKVREQHLSDNPLCVDCLADGIINASQLEVHHTIKHHGNKLIRDNPNYLMTLCKRHHSIRTKKGE